MNASALPKEIVLSVGRVPKASVAPVVTFNCLESFVVFVLEATAVFKRVAVTLTKAPSPNKVSSVIVNEPVPAPLTLLAVVTNSPTSPAPSPAVKIETV